MKHISRALWLILGACLPVLAAPSGPPAGNYIQLRSSLQSGATFYVSSGTIAGPLNVTGILSVKGSTPVLSTSTLQSGATFYVSSGTVAGQLSVGSMPTLLVSSNTILSGATFYQNAPAVISTMTVSSATINVVNISTPNWKVPEGQYFQGERCAKEVQFTITSGTSTTLSSFIPTSLSGSITPHSTSSYVKVGVSGPLTNGAGANAILTLFRNGSNVAGTNGFQATVAAASIQLSSGFTYIDTPATTSAVTYAVGLESSGGATATFCGSNFTCVLRLQECF